MYHLLSSIIRSSEFLLREIVPRNLGRNMVGKTLLVEPRCAMDADQFPRSVYALI